MDARLRRIAEYLLAVKDAAAVNPRAVDPKLLPFFYILDIERQSPTALPRMLVRLAGTELGRMLGRPLEGHYMEEFLHGPRGNDVMDGFRECANTHVPVWMRQVVRLPEKRPRFVEGIVVHLAPERLYGGLVAGEGASESESAFEKRGLLERQASQAPR